MFIVKTPLRLFILCVFFAAGVLFAQTATGRLTGTIYDQAGARLDHAAVTVKNIATGVENATQPNDKGEYHFENLPLGKYSIRVSAKGLASVQINDIYIQSAKTANINVTLPESQSTPISVVEVSEAPQPPDAPPPPVENIDDSKAILREITAIRDRLALSADQQSKIHAVFEDRQAQIAASRSDNSLTMAARREKVKTIRAEAESKFRALLNENQIDEYEEILRERRERALQRKQETALAPH
jgi:hypothetical protein